jgi:transcriptional regulator with XRE-family HTH domain
MDHNEAFGRVVKELRAQLRLSQESLAEQIALDRSYISLIERGKRSASLNTIVQLAGAFKVSPSQLIHKSEEVQKNG